MEKGDRVDLATKHRLFVSRLGPFRDHPFSSLSAYFGAHTLFTIFDILLWTICPLSFWYILKTNADWLRIIWNHELGKIFCGVLASITITGGKVLADQQIRDVVQSNPTLFPSAQQTITLNNILLFVLIEINLVIGLAMMYRLVVKELFSMAGSFFRIKRRDMAGGFITTMTYFYAYIFVMFLVVFASDFKFVGKFITGRHENPIEELLIWSSFVPNSRASGSFGGGAAERFCTNLEPDVWVSPFSSREAMPSQVVVGKRQTQPDRFGRDYDFRVAVCNNSANREAVPAPQ